MIGDWNAILGSVAPEEELEDLRRHSRAGRPPGDATFLERSEAAVGRLVKPQKRGPKPDEVVCPPKVL